MAWNPFGEDNKKVEYWAAGGPAGAVLGIGGDDEGSILDALPGEYQSDDAAYANQYFDEQYTGAQAGALSAAEREAGQAGMVNQGAQIATGPQDEYRQAQMQLMGQLQQQAAGSGGPSTASLAAQEQTDAGMRRAMAMAASGRGVSPGAAMRGAQEAQAQTSIAGARQAAMIKQQEMQSAQGQLAGLAGQGRGQDIGLATGQAGFDQQTLLSNQQTDIANQQMNLQQQSQNDALVTFYTNQGMELAEAERQAAMEQQQLQADQRIAQTQAIGQAAAGDQNAATQKQAGILGAAGAVLSDQTQKENIEEEGKDMDKFMKALKSYSYDYKDQKHGEGRQYGIMAQDLEKSKVGKTFVKETQIGKMVDTTQGFGAVLSSLARINERLSKVEGDK